MKEYRQIVKRIALPKWRARNRRLSLIALFFVLFITGSLLGCDRRNRADASSFPRFHKQSSSLSPSEFSIHYEGSCVMFFSNGIQKTIDVFLVSNRMDRDVFLYEFSKDFQPAIYLYGTNTIVSIDYEMSSPEDINRYLVRLPSFCSRILPVLRLKVQFPWQFETDVLFRESFDEEYMSSAKSDLVVSNRMYSGREYDPRQQPIIDEKDVALDDQPECRIDHETGNVFLKVYRLSPEEQSTDRKFSRREIIVVTPDNPLFDTWQPSNSILGGNTVP